jgi:uncharacterized protein YjlB
MNRKKFLTTTGIAVLAIFLPQTAKPMTTNSKEFYFKDDGMIPNNRLPLVIYQNAFKERGTTGAVWLEQKFFSHNWSNSWRNGIYSFHHYHSTSHEVLGIYSGSALVHLGGEDGEKLTINAGDIVVIPAGVGHKNLGSKNLGVVGAYPDGRSWDMNRGLPGERPQADKNIAALPIPSADPLLGDNDGIIGIWT